MQVSPKESMWVQMNPSESKLIQMNPSESKSIQMNPSESKWALRPILLSNFSWLYRYIYIKGWIKQLFFAGRE